MINKSVFFVFIMIISCIASFGQPGSLDGDFDADGKVITDITNFDDVARSVAVQADGKIVVAGYTGESLGLPVGVDFAVVRYNIDGSLDNSFSVDGVVTSDFGAHDWAFSIAIQPDGKIIVAGASGLFTSPPNFAMLRYNADGTLDNSFSLDGKVLGPTGSCRSVALQSDGKILLAGTASSEFALLRYNSDGTPDNSFGTDGMVTTDIGIGTDRANSMAIQSNGKIVVVGHSDNGTDDDFAIVRYNSDGSLDDSFSVNGMVTTAIGIGDDFGNSVVIQPDGKILVAGRANNGEGNHIAVVRYHADGTLDNSFNTNGKVNTTIGVGSRAESVILQPDGKIVITGASSVAFGSVDFTLVRSNTDGSIDNSFDTDGIVTTDFGLNSSSYCSAIQSNGRIVAAGIVRTTIDDEPLFAVARYISGSNLGVISFSKQDHGLLIYPNPLQESAVIEYTLTNDETISIDLYNISGSLVQSFVRSEKRTKGSHRETMNLDTSIPSGSYILTLSNGKGSASVQVVK